MPFSLARVVYGTEDGYRQSARRSRRSVMSVVAHELDLTGSPDEVRFLRAKRASRLPARMSEFVKVFGCRPHEGGAAHTGAGVRKPPREETAGDLARWRVRRYGDFDAGGLLPRCVGAPVWEATEEATRSIGRSRWAEPASRGGDRTTRRLSGRRDGELIIAGREPAKQTCSTGMLPRTDLRS